MWEREEEGTTEAGINALIVLRHSCGGWLGDANVRIRTWRGRYPSDLFLTRLGDNHARNVCRSHVLTFFASACCYA